MNILEKTIVRSNGLVTRNIDGEAFIMTDDGKNIHMVNKVGTVIWECANGSLSIEDVIGRIVQRFDVPEETARIDCLQFIQELSQMKLLRITERHHEHGD